MRKGAQELSFYLRREIEKRSGKVITDCYVRKITSNQEKSVIEDSNGTEYEADYIIIAMPPARVNRIEFEPQLSRQRRYIN